MFSAGQIVAHFVGDYILQSHAMAQNKTKSSAWAIFHAAMYTLPFCIFVHAVSAILAIAVTHFFIDRFCLARYVCWLKNWPLEQWRGGTSWLHWKPLTATGYPEDVPIWMSTWLLIIADNILHIIINGVSIVYLR